MEIVLGHYRLQVDVEATRTYYAAHPLPWITCDCKGCRNFELAIGQAPQAVKDLFDRMGLDLLKPGELCYYEGTDETLSGGGWYHICGTILERAMPENPSQVFGEWIDLAEGFSVAFRPDCDLLSKDFPQPCFQMEFNHLLSWVLKEPNPYIYQSRFCESSIQENDQ